MSGAPRLLVLLYGISALIGQVCAIVWMKRLALVLGMTLPAVGAVLAVSLGGYAIGALAAGRLCRNARNLARVFAGLQAVLGAWMLALPFLFDGLEQVYAAVAPPLDTAGHLAIRLALVLPVLLPAAAAAGAVFPVVSAAGVSRAFAAGVGGSLAGALGGALLILPAFGINATLWRMGAAHLGLAAAACLLPPVSAPATPGPPQPCLRACAVAAVLGAALFLAETVWFHLVFLVVDQTAYAEGLILGAVFLAMAAGARGGSRPRPSLVTLLVLTAAVQLLPVAGMAWLALAWQALSPDAPFAGFLALQFLIALALVGLPAVGYGCAVPRVCEGFPPRSVGRIWAAHYLGGMAGALAAPFLVIPALGLTGALGLASACLGLPLLAGRRWMAAAAVLIPSLAAPLLGDATFPHLLADRVVFRHADGMGLVEVFEHPASGYHTLYTNRHQQEGGDHPDHVRTERDQGLLPMRLQHPHRRILVVGLGTGVTVGAMLESPEVESITCVDISEGILRAARLFAHVNGGALDDPRLRIVRQDGRNFIRVAASRFDLLLQDSFFTYQAGTGSMYAGEHFRRCREHLAPGGRMAQWISTLQIDAYELRSVVRTFRDVFPHVSLWFLRGYLLMIGGDAPLPPPPAEALRHFIALDGAVDAWTEGAPLNTEDNLLVEYSMPRLSRWLNTPALGMVNLRQLAAIQQDTAALAPGLPDAPSRGARHLYAGLLAKMQGDDATARRELARAVALDPGNEEAHEWLGEMEGRRGATAGTPAEEKR